MRTIDFETFPNGDPIDTSARDRTITNEFRDSHGVVFPGAFDEPGVRVGRCDQFDFDRSCGGALTEGGAHSGQNVTRPHLAAEFNRAPLVARLTTPQSGVSVWVAGELSITEDLRVVLSAYDADGGLLDRDEVTGNGQLSWTQLEVETPSLPLFPGLLSPAISRVEVTGRRLVGGEPSFDFRNFVVIDDLTIEGPPPPPATADTEAPVVDVEVDPNPEAESVRFSVDATDNRDLHRVHAELLDADGTSIRETTLCGPDPAQPCPLAESEGEAVAYRIVTSFSMRGLPEGDYSVRGTAEDGTGNVGTDSRDFAWELPAPVIPYAVEINQGVQDELYVAEPGFGCSPRFCSRFRSLVPGRHTLVRLYVFAEGKDRPGYSAPLRVERTNSDGSQTVRTIFPNVTSSFNQDPVSPWIDVPEDPGVEARGRIARTEMRPDLDRTLNYVIPTSFLDEPGIQGLRLSVSSLALTGKGEDPDWVMQGRPGFDGEPVAFRSPAGLGINFIQITGGAGAARITNPPTFTQAEGNILPYLRAAYPVSQVRGLSRRTLSVARCDFPCFETNNTICDLLDEVWWVFGGDDAPVKGFNFAGPQVSVSLGFVPFPGNGCAKFRDPSDDGDRIGTPAVAGIGGDTAAHEIGHNLSLIHASTAHGETRGGDDSAEPNWPGFHGTVPPDDFGVIPKKASLTGGEFGEWDITLVDPCFTTDPARREPSCAALTDPAGGAHFGFHDYMSYGNSRSDQGNIDPDSLTPENLGPLVTDFLGWTSETTFNRIWFAIARGVPYDGPCVGDCSSLDRSPTTGSAEAVDGSVDALLVQADLAADGSVQLGPVLRKFVPGVMASSEDPDGEYLIELLDAEGQTILTKQVAALHNEDHHGGETHTADPSTVQHQIQEAIPHVEGATRIVLSRSGDVLAERDASANPPQVRLLTPEGGLAFRSGNHPIRWEASDPDGDPLWSLIQYSPDGGETWQGIEMTGPDEPQEVELRAGELVPGDQGIIRVVVSDGLNTAAATPACPVAVGSGDAEECQADLSATKADSDDPVFVEDELTYELTVANAGPSRADDVELVDSLPDAVELATAPQGCSLDGASGELTCEFGSLEPGDELTVEILVEVTAAGELHNTATVSSSITDPDSANDMAAESTTVFELTPIDIKPGSEDNPIEVADGQGVTPVAVLSSADLDAPATIDRDALRFGRTGQEDSLARHRDGTPQCSSTDVDADGRDDLLCKFHTQDTDFREGDQQGILTGVCADGTPIKGKDQVRVVP